MQRKLNHFHIAQILLITALFWIIPIVFGFLFVFDLLEVLGIFYAFLIGFIGYLLLLLLGVLYLLRHRQRHHRNVSLHYPKAYGLYLTISSVGILGVLSIFHHVGTPTTSIMHIGLIMVFLQVILSLELGKRIFGVALFMTR